MQSIVDFWNDVGQLWQTAVVLALVLAGYLFIRSVVLRRMERLATQTTNDLDDRLVHFIKQFLWLIALFVATLLVLRINHIEITPLLAGAGIAGIAVGLAAKELLADIDLTRKVAVEAFCSVPAVIPGSATIVVRSLWDDAQGHLMAGVLVEGRYRIADVRQRTVVRSEVLEKLLGSLQQNGIPMAAQPVQITQGKVGG